MKTAKYYYENYSIIISRIRTISGLAFLIYTAQFYNSKNFPISVTTGELEKEIRQAYSGGKVDVVENYIKRKFYKYDVNSSYPAMMKILPLPFGPGKKTTEKDIYKIFGFVHAKVTAPSNIRVPILPVKINGKTALFKNTVEGYFVSEELKDALKYGYKIEEIYSAICFEPKIGAFDDFVNHFYNTKSLAKKSGNKTQEQLSKLVLNSLYGRFGLTDYDSELLFVDFNKDKEFDINNNADILLKYNDFALVKKYGKHPTDFNSYFPPISKDDNVNTIEKFFLEEKKVNNKRISAVQFSAFTTAYGRMHLNSIKMRNGYLGGDTDSVYVDQPLPDSMVGEGIGQ